MYAVLEEAIEGNVSDGIANASAFAIVPSSTRLYCSEEIQMFPILDQWSVIGRFGADWKLSGKEIFPI